MRVVDTKYGILQGITLFELYSNGSLKECVLNKANLLRTPYGPLIPQYQNDGVRRKYVKSLSFYPDSTLKSISLQKAIKIQTSIGTFPAELVTFHPNGEIKRLFPVNGKISGFWSEEEEYQLAPELEFHFPFGAFKRKIIGIQFYENGAVKSLTFWPRDNVMLDSPVGPIETRIGFSLYPDGRLKTLEPAKPVSVPTPIGEIEVFNVDAVGIHGDTNSLGFTEDGKVRELVTSTEQIAVTRDHYQFVYQPGLKPSLFDDEKLDTVPLKIEFDEEHVRFGGLESARYDIKQYDFNLRRAPLSQNSCVGCSTLFYKLGIPFQTS
jgi:antitoxin component YwqK of YwqJK toxin-antitoxin module